LVHVRANPIRAQRALQSRQSAREQRFAKDGATPAAALGDMVLDHAKVGRAIATRP
jgi:hypothetical protein